MKKLLYIIFNLSIMFLLLFNFAFSQSEIISVTDKYCNKLEVKLNKLTGTAHQVYKLKLNINKYGLDSAKLNKQNIEILAQKFFDDYRDILGIKKSALKPKKIDSDGRNWFITYTQFYNQIEVLGTEVGFTVNRHGEIVTLGADIYPDIDVSTKPIISLSEAEIEAKSNFKAKDV